MSSENKPFPFQDPKTRALARILSASTDSPVRTILVVGCGKGIEAAVLADALKAEVIGIDIEADFDRIASTFADLSQGDATRITFPDGHFDAVYSFHALEHIPNYRQALTEIRRVLRPGGAWLIGTPNRNRLVGYLGSKSATCLQKIRWNINDWKARLKGKFRNEYGAHAGYSSAELHAELSTVFSEVREITLPYYRDIYASKKVAIQTVSSFGLARWVFPAVYFVGRR
jgi:ubiquinone/menaquinone biosynthesis C-methylase UbiE